MGEGGALWGASVPPVPTAVIEAGGSLRPRCSRPGWATWGDPPVPLQSIEEGVQIPHHFI
jgi:hypothetical protein